jgi:hypothetical protein
VIPVILCEAEVGGLQSEASLGKNMRPYLKNKGKGVGVEPWASKYKAPSSIPTTDKKQNKEG